MKSLITAEIIFMWKNREQCLFYSVQNIKCSLPMLVNTIDVIRLKVAKQTTKHGIIIDLPENDTHHNSFHAQFSVNNDLHQK